MNLEDLRKHGAFVDKEPVKQDVTWQTPAGESVKFTVWVRRKSFGDIEKLFADDPEKSNQSARFLSQTILLGDGKDRTPITYQQAYDLESSLAVVLIDAVKAVNRIDQSPKASSQATSSGTN